jgi:hypothetical protein
MKKKEKEKKIYGGFGFQQDSEPLRTAAPVSPLQGWVLLPIRHKKRK